MSSDQAAPATDSWRIVVFTTIPDGLVWKLIDNAARPMGHRVVAVVTTPGPARRRSDAYLSVVESIPPGMDVLVSNHPSRWPEIVAAWKPDLIVSGGFAWLIPKEVTAIPRLGAINIHPALLPRHRGPAALEWTFRSGDSETGFTIHRTSDEFDAGAILAQVRVPVDDEDNAYTLLTRLESNLPDLVETALARVARGDAGEPQNESQATYAGLFEPEWREIDWTQPARTIHNQARSWVGFTQTPLGAFGLINGERTLITRTRIQSEATPPQLAPGAVVEMRDTSLLIQCGVGVLEILEWEIGEDEKVD